MSFRRLDPLQGAKARASIQDAREPGPTLTARQDAPRVGPLRKYRSQ